MRGKEDPFLKIGDSNDRSSKGESDYVWSLKDINFEIEKGDAVGIIGRNGAGKSTLLKLLSRVTKPTTGHFEVQGRIASLLEVGTGFNPEMTGRENIYLNGAILGMRRHEIKKKFDEIVDFAGVERYIDTPVKRYSSGMYVRLAFAVAAHLESEILIVDEVLAVGDAEFQKKCLGKMGDVSKGEGRTVLFVSHNMAAVKTLCNNGIVLENGQVVYNGDVINCVDLYLSQQNYGQILKNDQIIKGDLCEISSTKIVSNKELINNGENISVVTNFKSEIDREYSVIISIYRDDSLAFVSTSFYKKKPISGIGTFEIEFVIPKYLLNPGFHSIDISIVDGTGNFLEYLSAKEIVSFNLDDDGFRRGYKYNKGWAGAISPVLTINFKDI